MLDCIATSKKVELIHNQPSRPRCGDIVRAGNREGKDEQWSNRITRDLGRDAGLRVGFDMSRLVAGRACAGRQDLRHEAQHRHDQRHPARMAQEIRSRGRKEFGRPDQGRNLSGKPARLDSAPDRGRPVRLDPGLDRPAGISGRRRRALRGAERTGPVHEHRSSGAGDQRSSSPQAWF